MSFLEKFSNDLNIEYDSSQQDWGIENADPTRLKEFISYYKSFGNLNEWEAEELAELIFQSAEENFNTINDKESNTLFIQFIKQHKSEFPRNFTYWKNLPIDEWDVPKLINLKNVV